MNLASSAASAHSLFLTPHSSVGNQQQQQQNHPHQQTHQSIPQQPLQQHASAPPASLHQLHKPRSPSPKSEFLAIPDGSLASGPTGGGGGGGVGGTPTSLAVPSWFNAGPGGSECWRRVSSTSSSIFDMSGECEQLERAIRDNDVTAVKKFLHVHHGKFPVDLGASILDKSSCDSRSRRHSHVSQDVEILLLKSQTLIESLDRRESINTESDVPNIFRTSLHLAVQHGADDVLKLLLKFGVDPNEPSAQVSLGASTRRRRASSMQPEVLMQQLQQLHLKQQQYLQQQRQQQQQPKHSWHQDSVSWDGRSRLSCCSQHSGIVSVAATVARSRSKSCSPVVPPTIALLTTPPPPCPCRLSLPQ